MVFSLVMRQRSYDHAGRPLIRQHQVLVATLDHATNSPTIEKSKTKSSTHPKLNIPIHIHIHINTPLPPQHNSTIRNTLNIKRNLAFPHTSISQPQQDLQTLPHNPKRTFPPLRRTTRRTDPYTVLRLSHSSINRVVYQRIDVEIHK